MLLVYLFEPTDIETYKLVRCYSDVACVGVGIKNGDAFYVLTFSDSSKAPVSISADFYLRVDIDSFALPRSYE